MEYIPKERIESINCVMDIHGCGFEEAKAIVEESLARARAYALDHITELFDKYNVRGAMLNFSYGERHYECLRCYERRGLIVTLSEACDGVKCRIDENVAEMEEIELAVIGAYLDMIDSVAEDLPLEGGDAWQYAAMVVNIGRDSHGLTA